MINRITGMFLVLLTLISGAFNFYHTGKTADFRLDYGCGERDMEKYHGVYSQVKEQGGVPTLFVNGDPVPAAAYMTYIEGNNNYAQFADAGYSLFSVPVLFAGRWINANDGAKPFGRGIFDEKGRADFTAFDNSINKILSACPGAYIFPRLNMSMPLWWIEENPDCVDGTGKRELIFSDKYRETAAGMLKNVIEHVNSEEYASHIVGYQLAGGNTEEWFHFDLNGGCCKNAEKYFGDYLEKYYPDCGFSGLPDLSLLSGKGTYHRDEHLACYLEFANNSVAETICYLSSAAKEATGNNLVVGTFYGYSVEVSSPLYGTHALSTVLECDCIDFICSPNSYIGTRNPVADWTEMYPADSVRLHGKMCLQECDLRTNLTRYLYESAPDLADENSYNAEIWKPLESKELSLSQIRKSFSRQLIKGNGFWWFDMWGGWYNDPDILSDMKQMKEIYSSSLSKPDRASKAELAVFVDESAYRYYTDCAMRSAAFNQRMQLGYLGAPYDFYDLSDFSEVYGKYKAVLFLSDLKTELMREALKICKENRVRYISLSDMKKEFASDQIRAFCESCGVHIYSESDNIIYVSGSYISVYCTNDGTVKISLDGTYTYRELLNEDGVSGTSDTIELNMKKNEIRLFELSR